MSSSSSIIDQPILNPSTYDPARYGWTAIGGISSILDPHSAALRPESRVAFLKRMKENSGGVEECYYTILEPGEDETAAVNNSDNNNVVEEKGKTPVREGTRSSSRKSKGSSGCSNSNNTSSSFDTTTNDTNNINNSDINKPPKKEKEEATATITATTTTDPPPKKVLIHSTSQQQPTIDIYTYHRGRAGYEPRHFKTGELLCGTDPVDTNYGWAPGKSLCKVVVKFALGDGGEGEEYRDSDEEEGGEVEGFRSCGGTVEDRKVDGDLGNEGGDAAAADCDKDLPSRGTPSPNNKQSQQQQQQDVKQQQSIPHFIDTIDWDISSPSTPTPEEFAANIAIQYGLSFAQTMDLADSIQKQVDDFLRVQMTQFYNPITCLDCYGNERPNSHYWPSEISGGGGRSVKGGGGEGTTKLTIQRSNSTTSRKSRGEGGSSKASSSRGRVKSQSGIIEVIPPDQVQKANPSGNIYAAEVLKRAKAESQRHVREIIARGGLALEVTENESCHICRKGKSSGLRFHCGSHAFCDMHCAVRCLYCVVAMSS